MTAADEKRAKPTLAAIREERTANELHRAMSEWLKAGKPRKR